MNNKFGPDGGYRRTREPFWRGTGGDAVLRSPDQELETSGNYREPPDDYATSGAGSNDRLRPPRDIGASGVRHAGFTDLGLKGHAPTDERIRDEVRERLRWNDEVDATEISVSVEGGDVTLEGWVETRYMKRLAEELTERVPGVIEIHNGLHVRGSAPPPDRTSQR